MGKWKIRRAVMNDVEALLPIYERARRYMAACGNPDQWINGYPGAEDLQANIERESLMIIEGPEGQYLAAFCFLPGPDPTYAVIEEGQWPSEKNGSKGTGKAEDRISTEGGYHVIHRLASDGSIHGIAEICFDWCAARATVQRADTHADNKIMQHILEKYGFERCGIIYTHNGTPRIAYEFSRN